VVSHPLHDYVAKQLADKIKASRVVVWYDERSEFTPFVDELRGGPRASSEPASVSLGGTGVYLAEYAGSEFEVRAAVEPYVSGDQPSLIIIYMSGCRRDRRASVLMELEKAGTTWEPQLEQLARNLLKQEYKLGVVDELLPAGRKVAYQDLARVAAETRGAEPPSILKSIFHDTAGVGALLAAWIVSDDRDDELDNDATRELVKLVRSRLGLELPADAPLAKLRAITLRYVLVGEYRLDLSSAPPASLEGIAKPGTKDEQSAVRALARRLRTSFSETYAALADRVEQELALTNTAPPASALGSIDTFRFEERALLRYVGDLIADDRFDDALAVVRGREHSFWLDHDIARKAHWEAVRRMAELGAVAKQVRSAVSKTNGDTNAWLNAYTSGDGWYRLDQAQRRMESWVANLDDDPEERPLGVVRRAYEDACNAMAEGFTKAMMKGGWAHGSVLHQTNVFRDAVTQQPKPVAYFLVDAMRFEMGVELKDRMPKTSEVSIRPAVGALPSITPIGMAALMPAASGSFSVVESGGELGVRIEEAFLPDLAARRKFASVRIPKLVDLTLDELLSLQPSKLAKRVDGAQVVIVRSQEIDHAGETGFTFQARQVMDTVIDNLARAIRKLATAGIEHAVVSADHGHLFFPQDRDESMRTDSPGGKTVELHRRCWIGFGGATPVGCVRVPATSLGYASDLDFVFPTGLGVFKAGGDLAFHHGGPSLQEMVIPVLTVRTKGRESVKQAASSISVSGAPEAITNRIFSVMMFFGEQQMAFGAESVLVRPLLISAGKQVGAVGMAVDADFDRATGCVRLEHNKPVTVAFLLSDESAPSVRVVVQDPATDAELFRSPAEIPVRLGV
jgi:hypothetical protein